MATPETVVFSLIGLAVGLVMAASGGYILYDRRTRMQEAAERGGANASGSTDSDDEDSIFS